MQVNSFSYITKFLCEEDTALVVKVSHYLYIESRGTMHLYAQANRRALRPSVLGHVDAVVMWSRSGPEAADPPLHTLER